LIWLADAPGRVRDWPYLAVADDAGALGSGVAASLRDVAILGGAFIASTGSVAFAWGSIVAAVLGSAIGAEPDRSHATPPDVLEVVAPQTSIDWP
jgi:hypothetical protein